MKKLLLVCTIGLLSMTFTKSSVMRGTSSLPSIILKDIDGNSINTSEIENDGNPIVISFWATWCKCCETELNAIADVYEDWQDETGVKYIAVSLDNEKTKRMVEPTVNSSGWEFDILLDPNGDLKRAMGVNIPPHTFLFNEDLEIVYSHTGYVPGDEDVLYEHILEAAEK